MVLLNAEVVRFLLEQSFTIVATISGDGSIHSACKGIIKISDNKIYLLDLYRGKTLTNLHKDSNISIIAVDEHEFKGFCVKGKARIMTIAEFGPELIKAWEDRIASRVTQRLLKNIKDKKGHRLHPEALLPKPEYVIVLDVKSVVDLTPHQLK